jgi:hypothetical protein
VFNWPFYGACIAVVHQLTSLSIHQSAQLLNMLFFSITVAGFLSIIRLAGGTSRTMVAGLLLLFSAQYIVGDVLEMLMRDEGFWAFYLSAIFFFIRYYQTRQLQDALLWQLSMMIATLFRIEAILYLFFIPSVFLSNQALPYNQRIKHFLICHSFTIALLILACIALAATPGLSMQQFGRLQEVFSLNLYHELTQNLFTRAEIMSHEVLGEYLEEFAIAGLLLTFVLVIISKIFTAGGVLGTVLAGLCMKEKPHLINQTVRHVLFAVMLIALISMALIITKVFVLSSRYVVAFAWVLLIYAAFYLANLWSKNNKRYSWINYLIIFIIALGLIKNVMPKQSDYNYMQEAVAWVKTYNIDNKPVFYDEARLRYYAGQPFIGTWPDTWLKFAEKVNSRSIIQYDYLVISHSAKHQDRKKWIEEKLPNYSYIKHFEGPKGKKHIVVYKKLHEQQ